MAASNQSALALPLIAGPGGAALVLYRATEGEFHKKLRVDRINNEVNMIPLLIHMGPDHPTLKKTLVGLKASPLEEFFLDDSIWVRVVPS